MHTLVFLPFAHNLAMFLHVGVWGSMVCGERGDPAPLPLAPACYLALLRAPGPGVCLPAALLSGPLVPTTLSFLLGALRTVLSLKAEDSEAGGVGEAAAPHRVRLREDPVVPQPSCADRTRPPGDGRRWAPPAAAPLWSFCMEMVIHVGSCAQARGQHG